MRKLGRVPGRKAHGSAASRALYAAFELLGRRGCLRLLWELRSGGPFTFRDLQSAAALPPATLNTRLRELREAGVVELAAGYRLTPLGARLVQSLKSLPTWAAAWAKARPPTKRTRAAAH